MGTLDTPAFDRAIEALEEQAKKTAAYIHGHRGDALVPPAERIVLDCLRQLHSLHPDDRMDADDLSAAISKAFINQAWGIKTARRRYAAILRIADEGRAQ